MNKVQVVAVTQARMGSTRLPGKVMEKIGDQSLLELHIRRILKAKLIDKLIVATTTKEEDSVIVNISERCGVGSFRGSVDDVLDRFCQALAGMHPDYVVRLTADCPLIDGMLIDRIIETTVRSGVDYCTNTLDPKYPDGQDVEVFTYAALKIARNEARLQSDREHVTPYIWKNSTYHGGTMFKSRNFDEGFNFGHLRMTVDEPKDLEVIRRMVSALGTDRSWLDYALHLEKNPELKEVNSEISRNEGYAKSISKDNKQ